MRKTNRATRPLAVCLVSGGMDSCVVAATAARRYDLACLHLDYGQLTEPREHRAFHEIADFFRVPVARRLVLRADHFTRIGGSSLTDRSIAVPPADLSRKNVPSTYVPFRNAQILAMAVSWAEVIGAKRIFIGALEEDGSGYPDCRASFIAAFNRAIALGTRPGTRIMVVAPLIRMTKAEVVKRGVRCGAPFVLTWSCYTSNGPEACGACDSCALRLRGFRDAGVVDPVSYRLPARTVESSAPSGAHAGGVLR